VLEGKREFEIMSLSCLIYDFFDTDRPRLE
jgi:hypothetical protein